MTVFLIVNCCCLSLDPGQEEWPVCQQLPIHPLQKATEMDRLGSTSFQIASPVGRIPSPLVICILHFRSEWIHCGAAKLSRLWVAAKMMVQPQKHTKYQPVRSTTCSMGDRLSSVFKWSGNSRTLLYLLDNVDLFLDACERLLNPRVQALEAIDY